MANFVRVRIVPPLYARLKQRHITVTLHRWGVSIIAQLVTVVKH